MRFIVTLVAIHTLTAIFNTIIMYKNLKHNDIETIPFLILLSWFFHPCQNIIGIIGHFFFPKVTEECIEEYKKRN